MPAARGEERTTLRASVGATVLPRGGGTASSLPLLLPAVDPRRECVVEGAGEAKRSSAASKASAWAADTNGMVLPPPGLEEEEAATEDWRARRRRTQRRRRT